MPKSLIDVLKKQFGNNAIIDMTKDTGIKGRTPTGIVSLDTILGGGIYVGSLVELYGRESSGKSTLALILAANAQKDGQSVLWLDYEHAFNPDYAKKLGIDLVNDEKKKNNFVVPNLANNKGFEDAETGFDMIDAVIKANAAKLIVIDSLATMQPRRFIEEGPNADTYPLLAKRLGSALKQWIPLLDNNDITLVLVNHLKDKIGGLPFMGPQTYTSGGTAPKFYSNIRIKMTIKKRLKTKDEAIGNQVQLETDKNRHFPPYKKVILDLIFGDGFYEEGHRGETLAEDVPEAVGGLVEPEDVEKINEESVTKHSKGRQTKTITFAESQ